MSRGLYDMIISSMEEIKIEEAPKGKSVWQSLWELVRFAFIAIVIVVPIRLFIAEPFVVSGGSMSPTFENGNYLIVDKVSYKLSSPKRNDVIVFRYPNDKKKFFIKRIIGLPNETVDIEGNIVTIVNEDHKSGFKLDEPYVRNIASNTLHFVLKNDEYFVMGDNRSGSSDSRYWGAVNKNLISGKAFLRLLPVKKLDILPGAYKQKE